MEKLDFTVEQLIDCLTFTESDYNKAAKGSNANVSFGKLIQNIMNDCKKYGGTLLNAVCKAEDAFEMLGKKTYDVCFNDNDCSNNKGWHETYEYCKDYIESGNGTNNDYFADYKGGTVSIYCNETGEEVYIKEIK